MKKANLEKLLEESPEAYYWAGFLLADGSFVNNRICFTLALKDKESVDSFGRFIEYSGERNPVKNSIGIACMDNDIVPKIMDKFDFKKRKTYNPPASLPDTSIDLLLSMIIGFIDGDGSIRKQTGRQDCQLTVKVHGSWIDVLNQMADVINKFVKSNTVEAKINKAGYAFFNITNSIILKKIKRKALELELPVMQRKWDIINLQSTSRQEEAKIVEEKILLMSHYNMKIDEICYILGFKYHRVAEVLRKNNIKVESKEESKYVW